MPKRATLEHLEKRVDAKSNELIQEFRQHVQECQLVDASMTDEDRIFQGWAIQKIAGLQCLAFFLTERVYELERQTGNNEGIAGRSEGSQPGT